MSKLKKSWIPRQTMPRNDLAWKLSIERHCCTCQTISYIFVQIVSVLNHLKRNVVYARCNKLYGRFIHEMGHIHQEFLKSNYWHSKGLNDKEFMQKQIEVLGLSDIGLHNDGMDMIIRDFGSSNTPSILRGYTSSHANNNVKAKLKQMFTSITKEEDYDKLFRILGKDGKTYVINAKKMADKMANESHVYAPYKTWENVAEIFQGLDKGEEYSDLVMLMYDICGGGRVPNLNIKGEKYDDYIESPYNDSDLIRQLHECIEVKELV